MPKQINRTINKTAKSPDGAEHIISSSSLVINGRATPNYRYRLGMREPLAVLPYTMNLTESRWPIHTYYIWSELSGNPATYGRPVSPNKPLYADNRAMYGTNRRFPQGNPLMYLSTKVDGIDSMAVCEAKAIQRFYSNAKGLNSSLGVTIAEAPKTFRLIGDTAFKLANSFRALKKGRVIDAFKAIRYTNPQLERRLAEKYAHTVVRRGHSASIFAANSWLEMQYGWKPLLSEVFNACHDLASRFEKRPDDIRIAAGYKSAGSYKYVLNLSGTKPSPPRPKLYTFMSDGTISRQVGFVCYAQVIDPSLRTKANLGLTNPLSVAWELVPFSFVVDWFAPIGPYLDSLSATSGLTYVRGSKSSLQKSEIFGKINGVTLVSASTSRFNVITGTSSTETRSVNFTRTIMNTFPPNSRILRIKSLSEAFSVGHAKNGLALLRQVFS